MKEKKLGQEGQSTIEFLMTIIFTVSVLFLYIFLGINMTSGYLVHYATFMSSRAYLVADSNSNQPNQSENFAQNRAREVFNSFEVGRYGVKNASQFALEFNSPSIAKYEYVGVRYRYIQPVNVLKIFGPTLTGQMISESYIGREPTRAACFERVCRAMQEANGSAVNCRSTLGQYTLYDNGC